MLHKYSIIRNLGVNKNNNAGKNAILDEYSESISNIIMCLSKYELNAFYLKKLANKQLFLLKYLRL